MDKEPRKKVKKPPPPPPPADKEVWFDDVDPSLLEEPVLKTGDGLVKTKSYAGLTKALGMDCEMVGVGQRGEESVLARASLVNQFGHCVYDKYVKPREKVTDFRTRVSGIRAEDVASGAAFAEVQKEVSDLLEGRVLVGHALKHDLKVLFLTHPKGLIRDTSCYPPFRSAFGGKTPSLKNLSARMLGVAVQEGEHSSVQDAQAAMRLYTMFKKEWERDLTQKRSKRTVRTSAGPPAKATKAPSSRPLGHKPEYVDSD